MLLMFSNIFQHISGSLLNTPLRQMRSYDDSGIICVDLQQSRDGFGELMHAQDVTPVLIHIFKSFVKRRVHLHTTAAQIRD